MPSTSIRPNRHENNFDWKKYLHICLKKWWWFLISVIAVCAIGLTYLILKSKPYTVAANVLISSDDGNSGSAAMLMKQFDFSSMLGGTGSVDNEMAIMSSHDVMTQTVKDLDLNCHYLLKTGFFKKNEPWNNTPVRLGYDKAISDTLAVTLVFKLKVDINGKADITVKKGRKTLEKLKGIQLPSEVNTSYGSFSFTPTPSFKDAFPDDAKNFTLVISLASYSATAEDYQKLIAVSQLNKKVDIVSLSYSSTNPGFAKKILNTVIDNYNKAGIRQQRIKGEHTLHFLEERITSLESELSSQELGIEKYKKDHNLSNVEANASMAIGRAATLQDALISAESNYEIMKLVKSFIANPENKYSLIPSVGEAIGGGVQDGITSYNNQIMYRMRLLSNAKADNISVKNLDEMLDAMRANIDLTLDKALETARAKLSDIRHETQKAKSLERDIPTREREYIDIKRRQAIQEQLYLYLLQQREEKSMSIANIMPSGVIVDEVYILTRNKGVSLKLAIIFLFCLGIGIPAVYIFFRERMRRKIDSPEEVASYSGLPSIGSIPHMDTTPGHGNTEWSRMLQANLRYILGAADGKTVLVTSMREGEGKTLAATSIADEFAAQGFKTILVGADLIHPAIMEKGGSSSLADYLSGSSTEKDIVHSGFTPSGADMIPAVSNGVTPPNPMTLLRSPRLATLFGDLCERYDYIIIDGPAMDQGGTASAITASFADATVIVTRRNVSLISDMGRIPAATQSGIYKTIATVYNDADASVKDNR